MQLARWTAVRRRWANEPFRRHVTALALSRMISITGTRAATIAIVALVYSRSGGSGPWVAAAVFTQFATNVVAAPWAGAIGDRFDRRIVMIASDLSAAGVFVAIAFVHAPIVLIALTAVASVVQTPFGPASSAFLVMLVPESERARATAARASGNAIGTFLGGAVGGAVVAGFGAPAAFLLNSASFVVSALLVLSIRGRFRPERSTDPAHAGVWAGARYIARHGALRLVLAANGAALLGYGMINVGEFPLFAKLGSGAFGFGIATAGYGVGTFVGARFGRRAESAHREKRILFCGWLVAGTAIVACGVLPSTVAVVILFSIAGVGDSGALIAGTLITQRSTPDPVRARVFAASSAVSIGAMSVAMVVAGFLIGPLGPVALCVVCGLVTLSALVPSSFVPPRGHPPWRPETERVPDTAPRRRRWLLAT
jgi:MFS family permease